MQSELFSQHLDQDAFIHRLIDQSPFATWISDAKGTLIRANPALKKFLNLTDQQLVGKYNVLDDPLVEKQGLLPLVRSVFEEGQTIHFSCDWDGSDFPSLDLQGSNSVSIEATMFPIFDKDGELTHTVLNWIDVTEKNRLQEQLRQSQNLESVGRLAGGIAHDFNNYLGVITGNVELASEELDPSHPIHPRLVAVREAAQSSADLARQLLAFARKQHAFPEVVNVNAAIGGIVSIFSKKPNLQIKIEWQPDLDAWPVKIDPTQLDQILGDLCTNAQEAMTGGGSIRIATRNLAAGQSFGCPAKGRAEFDCLEIMIQDNGSGIEADLLEKIFEPFVTTKLHQRGSGLGLATVHGIVSQNRGFIHVASTPGRGATFWISLPRYVGEQDNRPPASPQPKGGALTALTQTVLIVEDNPQILEVTAQMLMRLGFEVVSAHSPSEALHLAASYPGDVDLLLTDYMMPEMTGKDLSSAFLKLRPGVRVLYMSGYTDDVLTSGDESDQGTFFLSKPFRITDLAGKVQQALAGA